MTIARSKEGPRAPLFYAVLTAALAAQAHAQTIEMSELQRCAALETEAAKLACFEAIVAGPAGAPEAAEPAEPEPAAASEAVAAGATAAEPPPVAASPESVPESATAASNLPDDEFGREHLDSDRGEDQDVLKARVIDVGKDRYGALIFHLDNGQVWKQMEARYYPYPKNEAFDVVISTGMMGEYRLQVNGTGRMVTIRRTK